VQVEGAVAPRRVFLANNDAMFLDWNVSLLSGPKGLSAEGLLAAMRRDLPGLTHRRLTLNFFK
jgi:hypothetical protein